MTINCNTVDDIDPMNFDSIFVNEGSGWYSNNRFLAPLAGLYYIYINAMGGSQKYYGYVYGCYSYIYENGNLDLRILHNGIPKVKLCRDAVTSGRDTRGKVMIIRKGI